MVNFADSSRIVPTRQRPDLYAPQFTVERNELEKLAPGYIFVTPYELENPGPYIFDTKGVRSSLCFLATRSEIVATVSDANID